MKRSVFRSKTVVLPMILLTLFIGLSPRTRLWAAPTASANTAVQQAWEQRRQDKATVRQFLADDAVRQKLTHLGLSPAEVDARVDHLSDQELRQLTAQLDQARAGGWHAPVIVLAVLAALGFLIWYLVEHHHDHHHD